MIKIVVFRVGRYYGYDGIVEFNKKRYIVALSCKSREEARRRAALAAKRLSQVAGRHLAQYPEAP